MEESGKWFSNFRTNWVSWFTVLPNKYNTYSLRLYFFLIFRGSTQIWDILPTLNLVIVTNLVFLIPKCLQPNVVDLKYFKLWFPFDKLNWNIYVFTFKLQRYRSWINLVCGESSWFLCLLSINYGRFLLLQNI